MDLDDAHVAVRTAAAALWVAVVEAGGSTVETPAQFYLDYVNETVCIAPPRPVAPCPGVGRARVLSRAAIGRVSEGVSAGAAAVRAAAACSLNERRPSSRRAVHRLLGAVLKSALDASIQVHRKDGRPVAWASPIPKEPASRGGTVTLLTKELAWGIHAESERRIGRRPLFAARSISGC